MIDSGQRILLNLFISISIIVAIQICILEYFHLRPQYENLISDLKHDQTRMQANAVSAITAINSLHPIEAILANAGVEITDEIKQQFPPKDDIRQMYGSEPIILGLDRCERFRETVVTGDGFIAPAGMFNTGTNLLQELLVKNCYLPERIQKHGEGNTGMRWQVPWGKHSPVSWRYKHAAPTMTTLNQTEFLPAVVIKDPYTWMDSMCRHSYAANWKHISDHCPNLIPISDEEKKEIHGEDTFKVNIRYSDTNVTHHTSIADIWNTWYGDWIDADFPRLIVRFEDLLFHAESVVQQVCECGGGTLHEDKKFEYSVDSAKSGAAHKGSNGLVKSMVKYGNRSNRLIAFTPQDLKYAIETVRDDIMKKFGYLTPIA